MLKKLPLLALLLLLRPALALAQFPGNTFEIQIWPVAGNPCPPLWAYAPAQITVNNPGDTYLTGATATFSGTYRTVDAAWTGFITSPSTTGNVVVLSGTMVVGDTIVAGEYTNGSDPPTIPANTTIVSGPGGNGTYTFSNPISINVTGATGSPPNYDGYALAIAPTGVVPTGMRYSFDTTNCTTTAGSFTASGGNWSFSAAMPTTFGFHTIAVCLASNPTVMAYSTSFRVNEPSAGYSGPCDVSGASCVAYIGTRSRTAAYASTGLTTAGTVQRADGAQAVVRIKQNGYADQATTVAFLGTDATCTGSVSGTTLSVSGCSSGTLHVNDQLSGTNITDPTYISSIGSCGSPPGTCTVNKSQTAASGTITAAVAGYWMAMTEQVESGIFTPPALAQAPIFLARCNPANANEACADFAGGRYLQHTTGTLDAYISGEPWTLYAWVATENLQSGNNYGIIGGGASGPQLNAPYLIVLGSSAILGTGVSGGSAIGFSTGTVPAATLTDIAATYDTGKNFVFYIGGAAAGSGTSTTSAIGYADFGRGNTSGTANFSGYMTYGFWTGAAAFSSGTITALHAAGG